MTDNTYIFGADADIKWMVHITVADETTKEKSYCPLLDIHTTYSLDRLKSSIPEGRIWQAPHSHSGQSEGMKWQ